MTDDSLLTVAEAARRAGIDRRTWKRRYDEGKYPGVTKDADGNWTIPADAVPTAPATATAKAPPGPPEPVFHDVEALRAELAAERHQRELAEDRATTAEQRAVTAEEGHRAALQQIIDVQSRVLEMQHAAVAALGATSTERPAIEATSTPARRRWWRR